jgi:hypothetical protein
MLGFKKYLPEATTLEYHEELNPRLWEAENLNTVVRKKLLDFARAWQAFSKIPDVAVLDIIMTGGNANFNYTAKSDIDVHIVVDKDRIAKDNPLLDDYLYGKKLLWAMTHNITILGYPLEPYAQDRNEKYPKGQGVFSLMNNEWIQKPVNQHINFDSNKHLANKTKYYQRVIDDMIKHKMSSDAFDHLRKKISNMRSSGIAKHGEFATENLIFKELRNSGHLDKMNDYQKSLQDSALSL